MQDSGSRITTKFKNMAGYDFDILGKYLEIKPNQTQPFAWADKTILSRRILFKYNNALVHMNVDKAISKKYLKLDSG